MIRVVFDILHLYYLPQYLPVYQALKKRQIQCQFVLYQQPLQNEVLKQYAEQHQLDTVWVDSEQQALDYYLQTTPDWVVFGNAFPLADKLVGKVKTALMQHGIGPKACYYDVSESTILVRFVEGQHRLSRLQTRFPEKTFVDVGYAKLDPIVNGSVEHFDLAKAGLDTNKPTLLYAPTFYPSSIEKLPKDLPAILADYNLIVKPHYFSLVKSQYKNQRKRLQQWQQADNVYLSSPMEVSILPFMAVADLLISDASSTLFEFTALDKPAIWCNFYQLRWSYRGPLKFRFTRRLDKDIELFADVAVKTDSAKALFAAIKQELANPTRNQANRLAYREKLTGVVDGQCSERIADYLAANS